MKLKQTLFGLTTGIVIMATGSGTATALDTDIYYLDPSAANAVVKPNVLLVLDTSGSMNENVSGTTKSRIDVMKEAMLTVLDEMGDVNVGLMRFSHNAGGPVVYPIKNLDNVVSDEGNIQVVVQDAPDDAGQTVSSGSVNTTNTTLYLHTDSGSERQVGVRFRNTYIPQGVTITSAKIVFKAAGDDSDAVNLTISADKIPDAPVYTATTSNISGRAQTTATVDWSSVPAWTTNNFYETPELKTVVQEVVSQADWCRGNAMAFTFKRNGAATGQRRARSYDTYENTPNPNQYSAPVAALVITYDPSTVPTSSSCNQIVTRVRDKNDDAEEKISDGSMLVTTAADGTAANVIQLGRSSTGASTAQYVGVRFQKLGIPQGATITSAFLEFEVNTTTGYSSPSLTIKGQASGNAPAFTNTAANISGRTLTAASATGWAPPNLATNQRLVSPDIKGIVQEIVGLADWASGNSMAFRIEGTGKTSVESYDREPAGAALLRVRYSSSAATQKTVRDRLKELLVGWRAESNTPIVDALYEAALYYRGNAIDYGKKRGPQSGTYAQWTRVSDPATYTGGTLYTPTGCTIADPDSASCITEEITGSPIYISPIAYECQSNHIVLLTDGSANGNSSATKIQTMAGSASCSDSGSEACGVTLTTYLSTVDQTTAFGGNPQTVTTHTIGLNITNQFLTDLAATGGGQYKAATDVSTVVTAFNEILNEVLGNPTSFVSPSLSVNAFNRLYNRDEVYFTLFSPQKTVDWPGNLKKYTLCATGSCTYGEVLDKNGVSAIDASAKIKSTATSYWSSAVDGPEVQLGGAGAKIENHTTRRVYTYTDTTDTPASPVDLTLAAHKVITTNSAITNGMLGAASTAEHDNIITWMRGQDLMDENSDSSTTDERWKYADALHSRPVTITYGGTQASPVIKLLVGTNDGGVRMIDAATGEEDWIVYLPEFLAQQKTLMAGGGGIHIASVDGSPTVRIIDNNNDGIIDPTAGDKVQAFIGLRRGGRDVYAFDLSPETTALTTASPIGTIKPKLMWRIKGNVGNFSRLGQTWSRPQLVDIWVKCDIAACDDGVGATKDSKLKKVLIFGGGYDPAFDASTSLNGNADSYGNAIYIVDPDTGARQWWASGTSSGADLELANMKYGIPSDIAPLDSNQDGAIDRLYVGDTRGQLFRIDLSNQINPAGANPSARNDNTSGYVFADIGCTGNSVPRSSTCSGTTNQNRRSFFYPPDVAQVRDSDFSSTTIYDYVTIATGDREDPLDKKTQAVSEDPVSNRVYAFRDVNTTLGAPASTPSTITETNLYNANADVLGDTANAGYAAALVSIKAAKGWYVDLKESTTPNWIGEKSLARTTIFAGVLYVTTYTPPTAAAATVCGSPQEGTGKEYGFNLLNAAGAVNTTNGDRSVVVGGGIPSELVVVIREGGSTSLVGTSGGAKQTEIPDDLPRYRTFWYQE